MLRLLRPSPKRTLSFHPGTDLVVGPNSDPAVEKPYDEYLPPYSVAAVFPETMNGSAKRIVVSSVMNNAPNQIAVLDGELRKISEYWHPGHLKYG